MSSPPTIPAIVPLSLLEAIRSLDTPHDDGLDEVLAPEIVTKRLGLSATVAAQIQRYAQAIDRGDGVSRDEAISVFRLVGRRPDAALAFAEAGRRAARHAAKSAGSAVSLQRMTPAAVARRIGASAARRRARETFEAELSMRDGVPRARIARPVAIEAIPDGAGCAFYAAGFAELLRLVAGLEGAMAHEACVSGGAEACVWTWGAAGDYQ